METIELNVLNAVPTGEKSAILACPSASTGRESSGIAGIVGGAVEISTSAREWAESRKLSAETLALLGVASGTVFFPDAGKKLQALFFKYEKGWKARAYPEKHFVTEKGFELAFWNLSRVLQSNPGEVYITEGELDACALVEAGVPADRVLSVPNGAKERPADAPAEARGYEYVKTALAAGLNRAKNVVWCGDGDGPGLALRSDMVRLFGAAKFLFVEWPEGCKDANDLLRTDGAQALHDLVTEGALQWPVDGLYLPSELPEPPQLQTWGPGFPEWENKVRLAPRTISVVTGQPGHGKTLLWHQIWFQISHGHGVPICIASFETDPKPHVRRQLRTLLSGRLERDMSDAERAKADAWIQDRYLFMVHPDRQPTLDWFLDRAEVAVVRHGAKIVQLDPWNRLEPSRAKDESETEYVGRCLRTLHSFAKDLNCHIQIIAHPAKMSGNRRGEPPQLEDISSSKHWENMVDQGFVVYRPALFEGGQRKTEATLFHAKARFEQLGYPCQLELNYDVAKGRYVSIDYPT